MHILFITHPYPNYVPDLLLHGLRKLIGPQVVDYPRKDCVYEGVLGLGVCPDDQRSPNWFPDDGGTVDRTDIWSKVKKGYFDMVVCDLRALDQLSNNLASWPPNCVLVDGEDFPNPLQPGPFVICRRETDGSDYSIPLPMALPEEIYNWITRYDRLPKRYSIGFLGSTHNDNRKELIDALSRIYADTLFQATEIPSSANPVPEGRLDRDGYYQQIQQCRMLLSMAGAGYDTFRFWEHAACYGAHISAHLPIFIPDDFVDDREIIRFHSIDTLRRKIDALEKAKERQQELIQRSRQKIRRYHLTTHRATYFLDRVGKAFGN